MLWSRVRANDLEFYAGQTLNGVLLTKSGMIAASHLAGTGGLKSFIQSGGVTNAKDSNQTSVVDYLKLFASYDTPASFLDNVEKNNVLKGGAGADIFVGGAGDDRIDGGAGVDIASYAGHRADFTVQVKDGAISVGSHDLGNDTLSNIERLKFDDGTLAFDTTGIAGVAYRLYQASFDRTPDASGLAFWIERLDSGKTNLQAMADSFIHSAEFVKLYGTEATVDNTRYVELLYENTLGRLPDSAGEAYWIDRLDHGSADRNDVLALFSESAENNARVAPAIADGIWFA
jgi:Ca2+-binding RTX toxin-like protein